MRRTKEKDECREEEGRTARRVGADLSAPSFAIFLRTFQSACGRERLSAGAGGSGLPMVSAIDFLRREPAVEGDCRRGTSGDRVLRPRCDDMLYSTMVKRVFRSL